MATLLRCIDLETTGEDPDVAIVEVGWCDLRQDSVTQEWEIAKPDDAASRYWDAHLVNPGQPITPESSGVHHITDEDVIGAMKPPDACALMFDCPTSTTVIVAYHADGDKKTLGGAHGYRWIDAWKIAVVLAPSAPGFKLQTLRYWLDLDLDRQWSLPAHRAGPDAYVLAALLSRMLAKKTVDEMVFISNGPICLPRFGFGKHAKVPIKEIPTSYLEWILKEGTFDENVNFTCETELKNRRGK